jgi:hypothetical protein
MSGERVFQHAPLRPHLHPPDFAKLRPRCRNVWNTIPDATLSYESNFALSSESNGARSTPSPNLADCGPLPCSS